MLDTSDVRHSSVRALGHAHSTDPVRVLIVDDDPDFLDLLICEIGQIPRVHVTVAHTPEEALNLLENETYKLIVSDWALDDSTAPEVLSTADRTLRRTDALDPIPLATKIPVMFISGSEKVNETRVLHSLTHFEPVSFVLKRCGPPLIGLLASHILERFSPNPGTIPC